MQVVRTADEQNTVVANGLFPQPVTEDSEHFLLRVTSQR